MKQFVIILFVLLFSLPAYASSTPIDGPLHIDVTMFKNLSTAKSSQLTAGKTIVISNHQTVNNLTIPKDRLLFFKQGGRVTINSSKNLIINGAISTVGNDQIFDGKGSVKGLQEARPEWFSTNMTPGITDMAPAIAAAFASSNKIIFSETSYLMNSGVTKTANNVKVDFGKAKLINGGVGYLFTFGKKADTPSYSGLEIRGGQFEQSIPTTTENYNYILIASIKDFSIKGVQMKNVSNGGITVYAGSEDGVIDGVKIYGKSGYSFIRGLWLNGATASDFAPQLVDITSITRNSTPVPVYSIKNVKVINCTIIADGYGIYLINTRNCQVLNNYIDISGAGAKRCMALNNYSPGAIVKGNTFISDRSSTGILITQCAHDVLIDGNVFKGTFGGNRDIYVQYLADALIVNNQFNTDSVQQILIDMGGSAIIRGNYFTRSAYSADTRAVKITTIDEAAAGKSTYGDTATTLPGVVFENNVVKKRNIPVFVTTPKSTNGNIPGLDVITVRNNIFYDFDTAKTVSEYGTRIVANGSTFKVKYSYHGNTVYPEANANRNKPNISGKGAIEVSNE